jgi:hypothetical protein
MITDQSGFDRYEITEGGVDSVEYGSSREPGTALTAVRRSNHVTTPQSESIYLNLTLILPILRASDDVEH